MDVGRKKLSWRFWLQWVLANSVGMATASTLVFPCLDGVGILHKLVLDSLSDVLPRSSAVLYQVEITLLTLGIAIVGAMLGALVGGAQWLVLRQGNLRSRSWFVVTSAGMLVGFPIASWLALVGLWTHEPLPGFALAGLVLGISVGLMQWLFLRKRMRRGVTWLLANAVGMAVGLAIGGVTAGPLVNFLGASSSWWAVLVGGISGTALGPITGAVLVLLLNHSTSYGSRKS